MSRTLPCTLCNRVISRSALECPRLGFEEAPFWGAESAGIRERTMENEYRRGAPCGETRRCCDCAITQTKWGGIYRHSPAPRKEGCAEHWLPRKAGSAGVLIWGGNL